MFVSITGLQTRDLISTITISMPRTAKNKLNRICEEMEWNNKEVLGHDGKDNRNNNEELRHDGKETSKDTGKRSDTMFERITRQNKTRFKIDCSGRGTTKFIVRINLLTHPFWI